MDFQYICYTSEKQLVKGKLIAPDEDKAVGQLNSLGYQVISIKSLNSISKLGKSLNVSFTAEVKPKEVIMFSRQMALLLESGIDVVTAIDLFRSQASNKAFKGMLEGVIADLRGGTAFSDALAKLPRVFPVMYCRTIAAGEQSGNLDVVLKRMADYMERTNAATKKVKGAMTYPIIVMVVAIVVVAALIFFVFPTFTKLYSTMGAKLPLMTTLLLNFANGALKYGVYFFAALIAIVISVVLYVKTPTGRIKFDKLMLRLPVIGPIV